jgi:DME family drug/metabolite transporter
LTVALYLGAVTTTLGYVLYARGLRTTSVPTATTLTMAEPVVAALLGLIVLNERLGAVAFAGLGVIYISLILLVPRGKARSPRPPSVDHRGHPPRRWEERSGP